MSVSYSLVLWIIYSHNVFHIIRSALETFLRMKFEQKKKLYIFLHDEGEFQTKGKQLGAVFAFANICLVFNPNKVLYQRCLFVLSRLVVNFY